MLNNKHKRSSWVFALAFTALTAPVFSGIAFSEEGSGASLPASLAGQPAASGAAVQPESLVVKSVSVRILNPQAGAKEFLDVDFAAVQGLQKSFQNDVLSIAGDAPLSTYSKVLETLSYRSEGNIAITEDRQLELAFDDGKNTIIKNKTLPVSGAKVNASEDIGPKKSAKKKVAKKAKKDSDTTTAARKAEEDKFSTVLEPAKDVHIIDAANSPEEAGIPIGESLKDVLVKAYQNNEALKASRSEVQASDEKVSQVISEWMPTVIASGEFGSEKTEYGRTRNSDSDKDSRRIGMSLPFFNSGNSLSKFKRDKNVVLALRSRLEDTTQNTLLEAVTSYMEVYRTAEVMKLSANNEASLKKHMDATRARFKVSEVTKTDVAQAESRMARATAERIKAEGDYDSAVAQYARVVGEEPKGVYLQEAPTVNYATEADLVAAALAKHPLVKYGEYTEAASRYDITQNKTAMLPSASFNVSKERSEGGFLGVGVDKTDTESVTVNVTVPLYQGGADYSRVRQAKRISEKAKHEWAEQQRVVKAAAIKALKGFEVSREAINSIEVQVKSAEDALDGVEQEVSLGTRSTLDVLDAEQELFEAKILMAGAQRNLVVSAYNLLAQVGRLNPVELGLKVDTYDPAAHYDIVKNKVVGF